MAVTKGQVGSPLPVGKTFNVLKNSTSQAGEDVHEFGVDADGILISVVVTSVIGTVDVKVDTLGKDDERRVITFPSISSPTAEPVIRTAVNILSTIRVTVSYTGSCNYHIRARGISRGGAGADDAQLEVDLSELTVTNPTISNITLTMANTEQAVVLPAGTKRFSLQARNDARLQYSYISGQSDTVFETVWAGNSLDEQNIDNDSLTIYIQSNKTGTILELRTWI